MLFDIYVYSKIEFALREVEFAVEESEFAAREVEFAVKENELAVKKREFAVTLVGHRNTWPQLGINSTEISLHKHECTVVQ